MRCRPALHPPPRLPAPVARLGSSPAILSQPGPAPVRNPTRATGTAPLAARPPPAARPPAVYIERPEVDPYGCPLISGPVAQEMHRFLIHMPSEWAVGRGRGAVGRAWHPAKQLLAVTDSPATSPSPLPVHSPRAASSARRRPPRRAPPRPAADGQPVSGERDKKAIYDVVKAHLMGTSVQQQAMAAAGAGSYDALYGSPAGGEGGGEGGLEAHPVGGTLHDPQQQSILRALSGKWKFGG